ncbi:MAG TPA: hypothetical protein VNA28_08655 [Solirubrobacteraceae bacterium]|nr:hypothetical protein [Solirubrobacteraceae bacterium]
MPDDETVKGTQVTHHPEGGATGRRFHVCLGLIARGVIAVVAGVLFDQWLLIGFGALASSHLDLSPPGAPSLRSALRE